MQLNNFCGIDIGCTNIKMVASFNNNICKKSISSGDNFTQKELLESIYDFYLSHNHNFSGLGIAFSGCTSDCLKVDQTTLQCLQGLSISDFSGLNCKIIRFINDSNATTLAGTIEFPNAKTLVGLTNGTGIGCGIAINSSLFTGSHGFLGEIYGNPIVDDKNITKIGKLCSGSKILKNLNQFQAISHQQDVISKASIYLGTLLVDIIHFYNPDIIYFSGGGFSYPSFLDSAITFAKQHAYKHLVENLKFKQSRFKNYAGCYGAMKFVSSL